MVAWVYLGLRVAVGAASMAVMASKHPELLQERFHPGGGAKAWDRTLGGISTFLSLAMLLVAGLDMRFVWSPEPALSIQLAALFVWLRADAFSKWTAVSNPFYSRVVRLQKDRGHTVVTQGPYRYVRHPGYAGGVVAGLATPESLGRFGRSWRQACWPWFWPSARRWRTGHFMRNFRAMRSMRGEHAAG